MNLELILFYAFATVLVLAAAAVVLVKNSVHAALFLVLSFFTSACVWLLLRAEFLGIALVLVYVGAVMVLFLFVVMMLDIKSEPLREGFARFLPVGIGVAILMFVEMFALLRIRNLSEVQAPPDPAVTARIPNTEWLGRGVFTKYMLPFAGAGGVPSSAVLGPVA